MVYNQQCYAKKMCGSKEVVQQSSGIHGHTTCYYPLGYDVQENQYIYLVVGSVSGDYTKSFYLLIM